MNSRQTVNNYVSLDALVKSCSIYGCNTHSRALLIIRSAPTIWLADFAQWCEADYFADSSTTDRSDRIAALLGSERRSAVIQLHHKPDYGLLAALAGTIQAGGFIIIGIPGADSTDSDHPSPHNALKRLTRLAQAIAETDKERAVFVEYAAQSPTEQTNDIGKATVIAHRSTVVSGSPMPYRNPNAAVEQDTLLDQACQHIKANERSCIVISGRRGRGKSTLMARLANKLLERGADLKVTAIHESALSTYRKVVGNTGLYLAPESVNGESVDTLLIDEAASFPIAQLNAYLQQCRNLVLTTTVEGYEASGRALALRIMSNDPAKDTTILKLEPVHPWRWSSDDPLEEFVDQLLLTRAPKTIPNLAGTSAATLKHLARQFTTRRVCRSELVVDDHLLANVHALLLSNHYQTNTKDLVHLMDAPTVQLWIQQMDNHVAGVLVLELEGAIDPGLHEDIRLKRRRLPNHLLPQLLAQMANSTAALGKRYARILRLAISPELRRQGMGSELLKAAVKGIVANTCGEQNEIASNAISAVGASFAADDSSIKFWYSQGFLEFHRGFRTNPRTGKRAVTVMQCYDPDCSAVLAKAVATQRDNEHYRWLMQRDSEYSPSVHDATEATRSALGQDVELLRRFAAGQRSMHDTFAAICRLSGAVKLPLEKKMGQSDRQHEREIRAQVQQWLESLTPSV